MFGVMHQLATLSCTLSFLQITWRKRETFAWFVVVFAFINVLKKTTLHVTQTRQDMFYLCSRCFHCCRKTTKQEGSQTFLCLPKFEHHLPVKGLSFQAKRLKWMKGNDLQQVRMIHTVSKKTKVIVRLGGCGQTCVPCSVVFSKSCSLFLWWGEEQISRCLLTQTEGTADGPGGRDAP